MSERLHFYRSSSQCTAVALPFHRTEIIQAWAALRSRMRKVLPPMFQRDEWAYLMTFLSPENLEAPFHDSFGDPVPVCWPARVARPCGTVAVWLPNNVSLLGPLMLVWLSLTGNRILLKGGSRSDDMTAAFLSFALEWLEDGALRQHLTGEVEYGSFDRSDPRAQRMVETADVRIVFGSDEATAAIHASAPALKGLSVSFTDRQSQAWVQSGAVTDEVVRDLIRVFAIYGRAGCTSPARIVILDGSAGDAERLRSRILEEWPRTIRFQPPMHVASENTMAQQWASACGWTADLAHNRHAVIASGGLDLEPIHSPLFLPISAAPHLEAVRRLPSNIQTIGYAFEDPRDTTWLRLAARSSIRRLVPIARMHHFGTLWDGEKFWERCFQWTQTDL